MVGIPLDGTSVNPARSLGPALFDGGDSLAHVWLFLLAPLVGAVLAVVVVRALSTPLVTEEAVRETPATTGPDMVDRTGVQLPADEQPVRIPPPATSHHDAGTTSSGPTR